MYQTNNQGVLRSLLHWVSVDPKKSQCNPSFGDSIIFHPPTKNRQSHNHAVNGWFPSWLEAAHIICVNKYKKYSLCIFVCGCAIIISIHKSKQTYVNMSKEMLHRILVKLFICYALFGIGVPWCQLQISKNTCSLLFQWKVALMHTKPQPAKKICWWRQCTRWSSRTCKNSHTYI